MLKPNLEEAMGDTEDSEQTVLEIDMTYLLKINPQDTTVTSEDSGNTQEEDYVAPDAKVDRQEVSLEQVSMEREITLGQEEMQDLEEEDDDDQFGIQNKGRKEQHLDGESALRSSGAGKKFRSRNNGGGSVIEQNIETTPSLFANAQKPSLVSSGGRHKQARRRNHHHHQGRGRRRTGTQLTMAFREILSESLSPWCLSCIHMVVELIVTFTHHCGLYVEKGGVALHDCGLLLLAKITDIPGMRADAERMLEWTRSVGTVMVDKSVKYVRWLKQTSVSCFGVLCAVVLLGTQLAKSVFFRLGGERGKKLWLYVQDSRIWKSVNSLVERISLWFKRRGNQVPSATPESPGKAGRWLSGQELERLLALAQVPEEELDPFTVLGVETHATEAELKRAYRHLAVQVHPDKNKHPRAGEAFKVLRAAWDVVSNPEQRREYELKRMAATELSKSMNDFLTKLQDDLKEAMNTMMCTKCEGKHKRFEMDREPEEARFCAECNCRHSAEEGDLWAESSMLGLRITYFACMDGKVYDITEWAGCQRIGISPDTHRVPYHISFGSKNNGSSSRQRTTSEPPPGPSNPADLQDFFNRIFQGGPPNEMAANGGFFPPGPPPHPPTGAGPNGPFPPPPQTTFFMPGGHRPEPSEPWAESGKPPRRRKKVRKPFQR
ncbi:dnaJ homolog subfamily C member 14 [Aplochiton taeniatus]